MAHLVKSVGFPDGIGRLDNKGRGGVIKLVGVYCKPAVLGLLKRKGKRVKCLFRAQPDKAAGAQLNVGLECLLVAGANAAVQTVAGNDEIGLVLRCKRLIVLHVGFKHKLNAQRDTAVLQNIEQFFAPDTAKAVAARAHTAALEKHFHIVPVVKCIAYQLSAHRVCCTQIAQSLV